MGAEEEEEMEFGTDEDKVNQNRFIPKLFCQFGVKTNGWHSKTVQNFATLLLTILIISLENFQTKLDLVWNLFPPKNLTQKVSKPNWVWFGNL